MLVRRAVLLAGVALEEVHRVLWDRVASNDIGLVVHAARCFGVEAGSGETPASFTASVRI